MYLLALSPRPYFPIKKGPGDESMYLHTSPTKEMQPQKLTISRCQFHDLALLLIADGRQDSFTAFSLEFHPLAAVDSSIYLIDATCTN